MLLIFEDLDIFQVHNNALPDTWYYLYYLILSLSPSCLSSLTDLIH